MQRTVLRLDGGEGRRLAGWHTLWDTRHVLISPSYPPQYDKIERWCRSSFSALLEDDVDLILSGAHEIALVHRFAVQLEKHVHADGYQELTIDLEYNRDLERPKTLDNRDPASEEAPLIRPDLVVHARGQGEGNLLVGEWKMTPPAHWESGRRRRRAELDCRVLAIAQQYGYEYGLAVDVRTVRPVIDWHLIRFGEPESGPDEAWIRSACSLA